MSEFTEPLFVSIDNQKRPFVLQKDFVYYIGEENSDEKIVVKKGFRTDFASIPRPMRIIFDRVGTHSKAALVHDFLYAEQKYRRKYCDDIFFEAMEVYNVNIIKKWIFYIFVRLFGWYGWYKHKFGLIKD